MGGIDVLGMGMDPLHLTIRSILHYEAMDSISALCVLAGRAVGGPDFSHLKAIFLARIRYPQHDEPIVKHDEPKFCNGQYWP